MSEASSCHAGPMARRGTGPQPESDAACPCGRCIEHSRRTFIFMQFIGAASIFSLRGGVIKRDKKLCAVSFRLRAQNPERIFIHDSLVIIAHTMSAYRACLVSYPRFGFSLSSCRASLMMRAGFFLSAREKFRRVSKSVARMQRIETMREVSSWIFDRRKKSC